MRCLRESWSPPRIEAAQDFGYNAPMKVRVAALGLWLVPAVAWASPVNMERIASTTEKRGWSANADLGGGVKEGNVVKRDLKFAGGVQYRTFHPHVDTTRPPFMRDRWLLSSNLALVTFNGNPIADNGFMHVRYTRMFIPRVGAEVFVQSQYNAFTNLRSRMLTGGGARWEAIHRNMFRLWAGSGYMVEYEFNAIEGCSDADPDDGVDDCVDFTPDPHPGETVNHRWTNYLSMQFDALDGQLLFGSTTFVQPRFDDFTDIRINTGIQFEGKVTTLFSLGTDLEVRYDSRPPRTVEQTDIVFSGFMRFRFG